MGSAEAGSPQTGSPPTGSPPTGSPPTGSPAGAVAAPRSVGTLTAADLRRPAVSPQRAGAGVGDSAKGRRQG